MDIEKKKLMDKTVDRMGEYFDVVVILASSYEDGITSSWSRGIGNDFARAKMCECYADDYANQRLASEIALEVNRDTE